MKPKNTALITVMDEFLISLFQESQQGASLPPEGEALSEGDGQGQPAGPTTAPISFLDRIKLFQAAIQWVAVKNRIEGESDSGGEWSSIVGKYHGRKGGRGAAAAGAASTANGRDG